MRHHVRVRFDLFEETFRLHARDNLLSRGEAIHAVHRQRFVKRWRAGNAGKKGLIVFEIELRFGAQHRNLCKAVALADFEIVEVVRRRDLHRA